MMEKMTEEEKIWNQRQAAFVRAKDSGVGEVVLAVLDEKVLELFEESNDERVMKDHALLAGRVAAQHTVQELRGIFAGMMEEANG